MSPSVPTPFLFNATPTGWHDGDTGTFTVDRGDRDYSTWTIRLAGCNARELAMPGGVEVRDEVRRRVPPGTPCVLATVAADKYGNRLDAQVFYAGPDGVVHDLVAELAVDGWVALWDGTGKQPIPPWPRTPAAVRSTERSTMTSPTGALATIRGVVADVGERALKTFAQTLLAYFGAGALNILSADWSSALALAGGAAFLSVLSSLASLPIGKGGTASLTSAVIPTAVYEGLKQVADYGRHSGSGHGHVGDSPVDGGHIAAQPDQGLQTAPMPAPQPHRFARTFIRRPHGATASLTAREVAAAYNYPLGFTGKNTRCGIVELGGGFGQADLHSYFTALGLPVPAVTAILVAGGKNKPDGPSGADGEVLLDIEVAAAVAPAAEFRVYFAPNTDAGFLAAIERAAAECDVVSISWGGPEDSWDPATIDRFDAAFLTARRNGCVVFCAAGDSGSGDGESGKHVDFPASSPNVVGCGGTRLLLDGAGGRGSETVWNDSPTSSATGGGVSAHFPGRQVPDVAGNADPQTGYQVLVDGQTYVIGGTSAVAPLYAGLVLLLSEAVGQPLGGKVDFLNTIATNPGVCFDVTSGNNGAFRAGLGRDDTTGFGVVDGGKLLAVLTDSAPDPAPVPGGTGRPVDPGQPAPPPPPVDPVPAPIPPPAPEPVIPADWEVWAAHALTLKGQSHLTTQVAKEILAAAGQ